MLHFVFGIGITGVGWLGGCRRQQQQPQKLQIYTGEMEPLIGT